jgi:RHS repeat-associated protein
MPATGFRRIACAAFIALFLSTFSSESTAEGAVDAHYTQCPGSGTQILSYLTTAACSEGETCSKAGGSEIHISQTGNHYCRVGDTYLAISFGFQGPPTCSPVPHSTIEFGSNGQYVHCACNEGYQPINGQCSPYPLINVIGDSATKALPAGPAVPLTAIVTREGAAVAGARVKVTFSDPAGALEGYTDAEGQFKFHYVPPVLRSTNATYTAECVGCSNTLTRAINVAHCEVCNLYTVGNPISPPTGEKVEQLMDWIDKSPHPLSFQRNYRSRGTLAAGMGTHWTHNWTAELQVVGPNATWRSADGNREHLFRTGLSNVYTARTSADVLTLNAGTAIYYRASDESRWVFSAGKLVSIIARNGWTYSLSYDGSGRLSAVTNAFGRSLIFGYGGNGRLVTVTPPGSASFGYSYDPDGRLVSVIAQDGTTNQYHYENADYPDALTGMTNEQGVRIATYGYNDKGWATSTQKVGAVDSYSVQYTFYNNFNYGAGPQIGTSHNVDPSIYRFAVRVTDGRGVQQDLVWVGGDGQVVLKEASDAPFVRAPSNVTLNAAGLPTIEADSMGVQTHKAWDVARRLITSSTIAFGLPEAQTTTYEWHPTFRLPSSIASASLTTAFSYDTSGNRISEIATDVSTGAARSRSWTYNDQGLPATMTDVKGGVWSYAYDAAGNLASETNPLGHVTSHVYDAAGRVVSSTAPNGLLTTFTYDARGRLLTWTRGGLVTTYGYNANGTLATSSMPDGLVITYSYDAAARLTGWTTNRGAQMIYTLDLAGNITQEEVRPIGSTDPVFRIARDINALNHVTREVLGNSWGTNYGVNANGDITWATPDNSQGKGFTFDALRRLTVVAIANATANIAYNALDEVVTATDFKGVQTAYARNGFGDATNEVSPDVGSLSTSSDSMGLPINVIDAMGQATAITRDAIGRPTRLTFQDGKSTHLRYDLTGSAYNEGTGIASRGYLSEIEDRAGVTRWKRDILGRVTRKVQALANGTTQLVEYSYNAQGLLDSVTYPLGKQLQHVYDTTGRLVGLNWDGNPLLSNITWNAVGKPLGWSWAFNNIPASRTWDRAGLMTATELAQFTWGWGPVISEIWTTEGQPADNNPASTATLLNTHWYSLGYDNARRVASLHHYRSAGWNADRVRSASATYDTNGNPIVMVRDRPGMDMTTWNYQAAANGNRLTAFSQTVSSSGGTASASVTYEYDANGSLIDDGFAQYSYDPEGRMSSVTRGNTATSPTTRYAHNALGQRVFKTEPLYPPSAADPEDEGFWASLSAFFKALWSPFTTESEQLGWAYVYDEDGNLIGEYGAGGAQSTGSTQYIWLPTPDGPVPVVAIINGNKYAVHADHLNTPRRLTDQAGQVAWQWSYTPYGDEQPTTAYNRFVDLQFATPVGHGSVADVRFNLRFPGQYFDEESGLNYNYFRSYDSRTGRYTQADPIGLGGGWNRFGYAEANALSFIDPLGLETCVVVTRNSLGFADHVALFMSQGGSKGSAFLYDPSGSYARSHGGGTGDFIEGKYANLARFGKFHKDSKIDTTCANTSRKEEEELVDKVVDAQSPGIAQCSINVSNVLAGSKHFPNVRPGTFWPGALFDAAKKR